ncbi:hypothetical protein PHLCEN_2v3335 [Hermanssonia centrifuga]|uniref:Uncharacterized protein n=1 Tax=Hermanssonia centrifuga TaxID=98765 RepID=A0A2R6QM89_9APHY|nr:hypothetical protein PHLCEN_2v3335 [Hermanssonia centrifuga]
METNQESAQAGPSRGRGRGKSRGGLGKYLRARGRGRGRGRPAEFSRRLVLEDEEDVELEEEEAKELQQKYSRRQLGTNADRYVEPEPELDSEGEQIVEPEVDISTFLERQRLSPQPSTAPPPPDDDDDDDIDHTLAHLSPQARQDSKTRKGRVQQIEWDQSLEEMIRQKAAADAARELKARFKAKTEKERAKALSNKSPARPSGHGTQLLSAILRKEFINLHIAKSDKAYAEAPALPTDVVQPKGEKEGMEDFLDDLLG